MIYLYSKNKFTPDSEAVTKVSASHRIYLCLVIVSLKTFGLERKENSFLRNKPQFLGLKPGYVCCLLLLFHVWQPRVNCHQTHLG